MISRDEYVKSYDFKKSIVLIKAFISEELSGSADNFLNYDFSRLTNKKYIGNINDPDMYLITQAIYIVLWGHIWELTFDTMGGWGNSPESQYPFRGDTIHACGKIGRGEGENFGYRAKYFGIDKKPELWNKLKMFASNYHSLGNFIVIPNRGNINSERANWRSGMRDYFDWFLISLYNYQKRMAGDEGKLIKDFDIAFSSRKTFEEKLKLNSEYDESYLPIGKWSELFFLSDFFENNTPKSFFITSPKDRLKITSPAEKRLDNERYFSNSEYTDLLEEYTDKSDRFITDRTKRITDELKAMLTIL